MGTITSRKPTAATRRRAPARTEELDPAEVDAVLRLDPATAAAVDRLRPAPGVAVRLRRMRQVAGTGEWLSYRLEIEVSEPVTRAEVRDGLRHGFEKPMVSASRKGH